jgi:hypothetical protein
MNIVDSIDASKLNMMQRWLSMMRRCYCCSDPAFAYYGARGIRVCQEWMGFESFYCFWGDPPFDAATIGRIDNDGHYEPSNCEWQSQKQQNNNTRRSRMITYSGVTQSIHDWALQYDIGAARLSERLRRGWSMDRALNTPSPLNYLQESEVRKRNATRFWTAHGSCYRAASMQRRQAMQQDA